MKVTFIGTSHGVPERERACSSTMLEFGDDVYFIDAGTSPIDAMIKRGMDAKRIKAIFTTHAHGDHTNGLVATVDLISWYFRGARVEVYLTTEEMKRALLDYTLATGGCQGVFPHDRILLKIASAGRVFEDENIRVCYFENGHLRARALPSYSILVEAKKEGKRLLFTGDMSRKMELGDFPFEAAREPLTLLVTEMAHMKPEHLAPYLKETKAKLLAVNHAYPYEGLSEDLKKLGEELDYPIIFPDDGEEINL